MEWKHLKKWTCPQNYMGADWPGYYGAGVGQHRDSCALDRSNFASMLSRLGGESDTVQVVREGHWAVGWVEWIAIHESDTKSLAIADGILDRLEDYPVVDEAHYSEVEQGEADQVWKNCYTWKDRVEYVREHSSQFEFGCLADMRGCIRGDYFAGYASELLT